MADLYDIRAELGKVLPPPAMLIIHLGSNDLVRLDEYALRQRVSVMLQDCATWCPTMTIVWSDILPRVYFGAFLQLAVERKRRTINRWARSQCTKIPNALCLHHPQFQHSDFALFRYDGVHLSLRGNHFSLPLLLCPIRRSIFDWAWLSVSYPGGHALLRWHFFGYRQPGI